MSQNDLLVIAYSNKETPGLHNYQTSLDTWGYQYIFLGDGQKWEGFVKSKIQTIYTYLLTLHPSKIVCVSDAYDMYACGPPQEVLVKFKKAARDLVIGAEANCGSDVCLPINNSYWKGLVPPKNRYCNGGFYIGYVHAIIRLYDSILHRKINNDQIALAEYIIQHHKDVYLDFTHEIVGNVTFAPYDFKVEHNRIKYQDNYCCFLHVPGSRTDLYTRYIYFGKRLLGNSFVNIPLTDRIDAGYKPYAIAVLGVLLCLARIYPRILLVLILIYGVYFTITM